MQSNASDTLVAKDTSLPKASPTPNATPDATPNATPNATPKAKSTRLMSEIADFNEPGKKDGGRPGGGDNKKSTKTKDGEERWCTCRKKERLPMIECDAGVSYDM